MKQSPILGLFAREGFERPDAHWLDETELASYLPPDPERAIPAPKRPAPRIPRVPRQHYTPAAPRGVRTAFVYVFVSFVAVLCSMAIVDVAARVSL